ncbi:RNA polymerase sigma factor [Amycolatopsis viridis]|uniref:RNA polymerase sigma factor 70 region 4 type 2 domain-containing protein n=1 Tax=Amycolatopsis viridis TaxID=185678 RepID=A0ABX0SVI0_9PSEU|nr:sigma-70 family RNA polymerase sigma factor [Amycolatopsis viridis]NIH80981.1 hypothetical protein [Amycolatopsis viridis]
MGDTATRELAGMPDDELLDAACGGDREAYAILVRWHRVAAPRYARSVTRCSPGGQDQAADAPPRTMLTAFAALPARWRRVLWMVEVLGHRPQDVAAELGIAPAAACSLLWRARTALRRQYEQHGSRDR